MSPTLPRVAVITVSDRCAAGLAEDAAGPLVADALGALASALDRDLVPDGIASVTAAITRALDAGCRVVVTTGGTGIGPRDLTPEATAPLIETPLPGIPEALRRAEGAPAGAALSRGLAGLTRDRGCLLVNLPGSPDAAASGGALLAALLPHALHQLDGGDHTAHGTAP